MQKIIGENLSHSLALRGMSSRDIQRATSNRVSYKTVDNIKAGGNVTLRVLNEMSTALGMETGEMLCVMLGETPDPYKNELVTEHSEDVVMASLSEQEADVYNSQLIVQLLRNLNEGISGLRADMQENTKSLKQLMRHLGQNPDKEGDDGKDHRNSKRRTG